MTSRPRRCPSSTRRCATRCLRICRPSRSPRRCSSSNSDEAVYLLEDLDREEQNDILAKLPYFERIALRAEP